MLTFLSVIFFLGIILFFGWELSVFLLKENRIFILLPFAGLLGISAYVFLLNAISYFVSVQVSFYLVFGLLAAALLLFRFLNKRRPSNLSLGMPKDKFIVIAVIAIVLMITSGLVALRALEYDDLAIGHINAASTISEGNFPVRHVLNPSVLHAYHYAPDLLSAAIFKITKLPLEFGYDLQIFVFSGIIFFFGCLLIYKFTDSAAISAAASISMIFGGGLNFFKFFEGAAIFYRKFILHQQISAPFKFLPPAIDGSLIDPLAGAIHNHSNAMGIPIFLAVIYLYFCAIEDNKYWPKMALLSGILFGFLALSTETYFAVLFAVLAAYPFLIFLFQKNKEQFKKILKISGLILSVGLPIALLQGGIITEYMKDGFFLKIFSVGRQGGQIFKDIIGGQAFDYFGIFIDAAIPLLIFFPAIFYLRKYRRAIIFLALIVVFSFLPPFLVKYAYASEMRRFWYLSLAFLALISGWFLSSLILKFRAENKKMPERAAAAVFFLSILGGLVWQASYMAFPIGNIGPGKPFLGRATKMSEIEMAADGWIKKNTTINDNFFVFYPKSIFSFSASEFAALHGRFAPVWVYGKEEVIDKKIMEADIYNQATESCGRELLEKLNIDYIYAADDWPAGLEQKCLENNNLNLAYQVKRGDKFRKVYKMR